MGTVAYRIGWNRYAIVSENGGYVFGGTGSFPGHDPGVWPALADQLGVATVR